MERGGRDDQPTILSAVLFCRDEEERYRQNKKWGGQHWARPAELIQACAVIVAMIEDGDCV